MSQTRINVQSLQGLLDDHLAYRLDAPEYKLRQVKASSLITSNRLDLVFKIFYLEMKLIGQVEFAERLYREHIKILSLGRFREPGNQDKVGIERFLQDFEHCFESVRIKGLDEAISVIPLSEAGSIVNGSHRVACAYVAKNTVPVVTLSEPEHKYDAGFFIERGMERWLVEFAVTKFIEYADNCYIALIWPSAVGCDDIQGQMFPNVIHSKQVQLNINGAHNLISQIYYDESWLGSRNDNFPGAKNKLVECFKNQGPLRVVAFQAGSLGATQKIKQDIRDSFGIGKHSIHISDTKAEAVRIARILFNPNSIHFLNHGRPNRFASAIEGVYRFKRFLAKNELDSNLALVDSSHVLSLYGLRESRDIDFLSSSRSLPVSDELIHNHVTELEFHGQSLGELVFNSRYYFYFEDLKFVSFEQLYKMKKRRGEKKDLNDMLLMDALIEQNILKEYIGLLRQKYFYSLAKLKILLIKVPLVRSLYRGIRSVYRRLLKRNGQYRG